MKSIFKATLAAIAICSACADATAEHLVILSANDTHSQIEPAADNRGGVMRRRAVFDKVRRENKNVVAVHAGDAVQGTIYFSMFGGDVEYALIDSLGYDFMTPGNHEFDNGIGNLAEHYRGIKSAKILSANYDVSDTPLAGLFWPWAVKAYGDKRVGFFAVNVNPRGMIVDKNYAGMRYLRSDSVADATAKYLKTVQNVDYVVMISHIGFSSMNPTEPNDSLIVSKSHYIDMVVGGHSHTVLKPGSPQSMVRNADGKTVVIGQNGKSGKYVGKYDLDLESGKVSYELVAIDKSLDADAVYPAMAAWLAPYKAKADSLMNTPVAKSARWMKNSSQASQNWLCDAVMEIAPKLTREKVQFAIMNKGGIRQDMPKGVVTEGLVDAMFPFDNRFVVLELSGKDLLEAFEVMANRGGDAVSKELKVTYGKNHKIISAKLNGKAIKPDAKYKFITIDFLANGGDYMNSLKNGKRLFVDDVKYGIHILNYLKALDKAGRVVDAKDEPRMTEK